MALNRPRPASPVRTTNATSPSAPTKPPAPPAKISGSTSWTRQCDDVARGRRTPPLQPNRAVCRKTAAFGDAALHLTESFRLRILARQESRPPGRLKAFPSENPPGTAGFTHSCQILGARRRRPDHFATG